MQEAPMIARLVKFYRTLDSETAAAEIKMNENVEIARPFAHAKPLTSASICNLEVRKPPKQKVEIILFTPEVIRCCY